jgi:TetR/AcrR family transcriptional repressor of nem operon
MREQIKELALDLLIQHGYRGVSFGDLAAALKTTRANIHYHFGNKERLVEEVLEDYVRITSEQLNQVWTEPEVPFVSKIKATVEYSRRRYLKFNKRKDTGHPWSLIARMRQDGDALTPAGREALQRFGKNLFASIVAAIEQAKASGEFDASLPTDDVALQLVAIANSAGPITQDAHDFQRLEDLYMGFARIVQHAYGREGPRRPITSHAKPEPSAGVGGTVAQVRAARRTTR